MALPYLKTFTKDPGEVIDYPGNWAPWLKGGTITAAVSTPDSGGITIVATGFTTTTTTPRISGGTHGTDYLVAVHVTKSDGQQGERSLLIKVRQR